MLGSSFVGVIASPMINEVGQILFGAWLSDDRNLLVRADPVGTDQDADGVVDDQDNCPTVPNVDQANSDEDTIGDACDNCRQVDNTAQIDADQDGIGNLCDADFDQSGFCNVSDLLSFLDAFGNGVNDNTCPDPGGAPSGPCAHYDLTGEGAIINVSDLLAVIDESIYGTATSDHGCAPADDGLVHCPLP
jgi:hypothetical protein